MYVLTLWSSAHVFGCGTALAKQDAEGSEERRLTGGVVGSLGGVLGSYIMLSRIILV